MTEKADIRVLCVDDNQLLAEAMREVIDMMPGMTCVGCAPSADDLLGEVSRTAAEVVLLDVTMPGKDPLEALSELAAERPDARVIVVTGYQDPALVDRAVEAGAWGFVPKNGNVAELIEAVRTVARGEMLIRQ